MCVCVCDGAWGKTVLDPGGEAVMGLAMRPGAFRGREG